MPKDNPSELTCAPNETRTEQVRRVTGMTGLLRRLGFNWQDGRLLLSFFRRSLRDRFLGSALGRVWAVANPLLLLLTFTFVFGFVFKSRLPGVEGSIGYTIWLIAGYGTWLDIVDSILSSTVSVVANTALVKNLAFKTELLPIAGGMMGLVPLSVSLVFLMVLILIQGAMPSLLWLWLFPIIGLQFLFVTGLGLFLSALNVFMRDISVVLPNLLLLLLFASPIFYPIDSLPGIVGKISQFNPFYVIAESVRQPLVYGRSPELWSLTYLIFTSVATFLIGLLCFRRVKGYFDGHL